jgi:hypothetical protein
MGAGSASDPLLAKPETDGEPTADAAGPPPSGLVVSDDVIPACCIATIRQHVAYNPMMVCSTCKNIIKCFVDERGYDNYLKFCRSRRRPVVIGQVGQYLTIAFRSYDTYTR